VTLSFLLHVSSASEFYIDVVEGHDYTYGKYYTLVAKVPCVDADEVVSCEFLPRFLPEVRSVLEAGKGSGESR
jgi:hypothetical protein